MAGGKQIVEAVATRIRADEKDAINLLPSTFGQTIADKLRVLIRYSLEHPDAVATWLEEVDGKPV